MTATDGSYTSRQSFVWTVTRRVALVNPGDQDNAVGDSVSVQLSATSPGGAMSYSATGLPSGLSINNTTGAISGTIASGDDSSSPYTVTVTANDGTSSSSQTFDWNIAVINLVAPGDQTNNDGDTVSLPLTTGYHGSGTLSYSATGLPPNLSISSTTGQITGTLTGTADTNSPYSVTVTVTDGTNTSTQPFDWAVSPVVTIDSLDDQSNADGDAVSLPVTASDSLNNTLSYSATHLPTGLSINSSTGLVSGTIALGTDANSPYAVTVTATDSAGNSASLSFTWTVMHVALVNPGPLWKVNGQAVSLQLQAHDADGDTVRYTASGLPGGLSINTNTGLISGTIASNADTNSPYNVTVTASDGVHTTTQTFLWTISQVSLALPSDQTNTEGDTVSLQLQGTKSSGTLTYSASGLPNGLSLNTSTGLITGTIAAGAAADGPFEVNAAVSNGVDSTSQSFTWTVNPVVNLTTPADQSNSVGNSVSLQISATDVLNKSLSYSASGLPSGLSINGNTGLISGTITSGDSSGGPYVVTVTASDGTYSSSATFNWNVNDTAALTTSNPSTQVNVASDSVSVQVTASDPDGDVVTYSATNLPSGLEINPFTGLISGILDEDAPDPAPYQTTVTATDGNGQSVSQTFTWLVNPPTITAQGMAFNAAEGVDPGSVTIATFTTPDMNSLPDDFTATINWGDGTTGDTGAISGSNGSFTVTGDHIYTEKGTYTITVQIADSLTGGSATASATAAVADAALTMTSGFEFGDSFTNAQGGYVVATFTDANLSAPLSDYSVSINWGDGNTTTGSGSTYVQGIGNGLYEVVAPHSYANLYPQPGPWTYSISVTLTDVDGASAQGTDTVVVGAIQADTPATMGQWAFVDQNSEATPSDFVYNGQTGKALINWGDGTSSVGTVSSGGTSGYFNITAAPHTYSDSMDQPNGLYTITVTVTDDDGNTLTGTQYVSVVRPEESLAVANVNIASSLTVNNVPVAAFTVPDTSDGASEFSAQINWGDGNSSSGTVQAVGPGLFQVLGSHTYAADSWYTITVTISQGWGGMAAAAEGDGEAGDTPKVTFWAWRLPQGGVKNQYMPVNTLSVGRWQNAFNNPKTNPKLKDNFISLDPARYWIEVQDPIAYQKEDPIQVTIASTSDSGHQITLQKSTKKNVFGGMLVNQLSGKVTNYCPPLLLTTFTVDKNKGGNQTLIVKLRDSVSAVYRQQEAEATVPSKAVVKLHINILRITPGGAPVATIAQVKADVLIAQKVYAAAGIRFIMAGGGNSIYIVNPPAGLKNYKYNYIDKNRMKQTTIFNYLQNGLLSHFIWGFNWDSRGQVATTGPEQILLGDKDLRCGCNNDIEVYYVNYLAQENGQEFPGKAGYGESFPYSLVSRTKPQYADSIIIGAKTEADNKIYQALAHEIGHILINNGKHYGPLINLMYDPPRSAGDETDSRRITAEDANAMLNNRKKLLLPPP